jgi:hypothetical protein
MNDTLTELNFAIEYNFCGSPYIFSLHQSPIQLSISSSLGLEKNKEYVQFKNLVENLKVYSEKDCADTFKLSDLKDKKVFINRASIRDTEQNFPFEINVSMTGGKFEKTTSDDISIYGAIIGSGYKGDPNIILINPDIPYHSENFIKYFHNVKTEDDLREMISYKIIKIPIYDEISEQFAMISLNDNELINYNTQDKEKISTETSKLHEECIIIYDTNNEILSSLLMKLPKRYYNNENLYEEDIITLENQPRKYLKKSICLDKNLFDSFISNQFKFIKHGNYTMGIENIFIRIHNSQKCLDNTPLWKSVFVEPDTDDTEYNVKLVIDYRLFVCN